MESGKERNITKHNLCELADDDLAPVTGGAAIKDDSDSKPIWKEEDKFLLEFIEQTQSVTLQRVDDNSDFVHQQAGGLPGNALYYQYNLPTYPG